MPMISWTYLWYIEHTCYIPVIYWISLWCSSIPVTPWKYLWYLEHTWYIINIPVISWTYLIYPEHTCDILNIQVISWTYLWYLGHTYDILNVHVISWTYLWNLEHTCDILLLRLLSSLPAMNTRCCIRYLHVSVFPAPLSPEMTQHWEVFVESIQSCARSATLYTCGGKGAELLPWYLWDT